MLGRYSIGTGSVSEGVPSNSETPLIIAAIVGNAIAAGVTAAVVGSTVVFANIGNAAAEGQNATVTLPTAFVISCSIGTASADGNPATVTMSVQRITRDVLLKVLRSYILSIAPDQRVLRTPINRASPPVGPFISMTPGAVKALATNTHDMLRTKRSSQFDCQIDCYGLGSGDIATQLSMLFRDNYAAQHFAQFGLEIYPLYAGDEKQLPIVNGEEQYEERWTFDVAMQFNPVVSTVQQSANILAVELINIDANFPLGANL